MKIWTITWLTSALEALLGVISPSFKTTGCDWTLAFSPFPIGAGCCDTFSICSFFLEVLSTFTVLCSLLDLSLFWLFPCWFVFSFTSPSRVSSGKKNNLASAARFSLSLVLGEEDVDSAKDAFGDELCLAAAELRTFFTSWPSNSLESTRDEGEGLLQEGLPKMSGGGVEEADLSLEVDFTICVSAAAFRTAVSSLGFSERLLSFSLLSSEVLSWILDTPPLTFFILSLSFRKVLFVDSLDFADDFLLSTETSPCFEDEDKFVKAVSSLFSSEHFRDEVVCSSFG